MPHLLVIAAKSYTQNGAKTIGGQVLWSAGAATSAMNTKARTSIFMRNNRLSVSYAGRKVARLFKKAQ